MSSYPKTCFVVLYTLIFIISKSGIVLYVQNASILTAEARGSEVQDHPRLHSKL